MTIPCEQKENIEKIGQTVDQIHEVVTGLALQNQRIIVLETSSKDHEKRLRSVEGMPLKVFYWCAAIVATVLSGWLTHSLWG